MTGESDKKTILTIHEFPFALYVQGTIFMYCYVFGGHYKVTICPCCCGEYGKSSAFSRQPWYADDANAAGRIQRVREMFIRLQELEDQNMATISKKFLPVLFNDTFDDKRDLARGVYIQVFGISFMPNK